jgi:hypothetical protein
MLLEKRDSSSCRE